MQTLFPLVKLSSAPAAYHFIVPCTLGLFETGFSLFSNTKACLDDSLDGLTFLDENILAQHKDVLKFQFQCR